MWLLVICLLDGQSAFVPLTQADTAYTIHHRYDAVDVSNFSRRMYVHIFHQYTAMSGYIHMASLVQLRHQDTTTICRSILSAIKLTLALQCIMLAESVCVCVAQN